MICDKTAMADEEQKALEKEAARYEELKNGCFMLMNDCEEHEIEYLMAYGNAKENR